MKEPKHFEFYGYSKRLEEHNQKTWEGVSWMVKLGYALLWGILIGAMICEYD
jgi:hypothetical protein